MRTRSLKDSLFYVFFGVGFFLTGCGDDNNEFPEVDGQLPGWRYIGSDNHFCGDGSESNIGRDIPAGTYTFIFDTHLVQGKLIPKNN